MEMEDKNRDITYRTRKLALRVITLCRALDDDRIGRVLLSQVLRSGTSIGANVEEAQSGQSKKDFIAKMYIAKKEARETHYWLTLIGEAEILPSKRLAEIIDECDQVNKMLTSIILTAKESLE